MLHAPPAGPLDSRSEPLPADLAELAKFGGTVIDAATSQPVEGVLVHLAGKVLPKDRVRSDARGRFGFDRDHVGTLWLEVPAQVGFRPVGDRVPVSDELRAGETEIVLRVERIPAAPLRARLVYPNGEPIPWCRVEITGSGDVRRQLMSDRHGRLAEIVLELGTASIATLVDLSVPSLEKTIRAEFEHIGKDGTTDVVLDAPATLFVRPPNGCESLDGFSVWLPCSPSSRASRSLQATSDAFLWIVSPCKPEKARAADEPWVVEVEHARWRGRVELDELEGIVELTPDWRALGSLEVSTRCPIDPPPEYVIEVSLTRGPEEDVDRESATLRELVSSPLVFDALEPGALRVELGGDFCRSTTFDVRIEPNETTRVVADLDCEPPAGFIEVRVATRTGAAPPGSVEAYVTSERRDVSLREGLDRTVARERSAGTKEPEIIRIGPLPHDSYSVWIDARPWRVEPAEPILARPGAVLNAIVLDDVPLVDVLARAVDAQTGELLAHATVNLLSGRSWAAHDTADPFLEDVPGNARVYVSVRADGYRFVEQWIALDAADVVAEDDRRLITIRLQRGWNAYVEVYEDDGYAPIAGAVILADDVEVARTDEDGCAEIVLESAPRNVEARSPGWVLERRETLESPFRRFEFGAHR